MTDEWSCVLPNYELNVTIPATIPTRPIPDRHLSRHSTDSAGRYSTDTIGRHLGRDFGR